MHKLFIRIVGLMLALCLVADTGNAHATADSPQTHQWKLQGEPFGRQAISAVLVEASFFRPLLRRWLRVPRFRKVPLESTETEEAITPEIPITHFTSYAKQ